MMATTRVLDDYLTLKSLWFYRNILDPESEGILTQQDFDRSAFKFAILYCKGDKIKEFCEMFLNVFRELWNSIKIAAGSIDPQGETINFGEFRALIATLSDQISKFEELPAYLQKLIDMLFESYDAKGDNGVDVDEYRLYLCARNMDVKRATECFNFMTGDVKMKIKKPHFRQLMFDFLTSRDPNSKGRFICGPFDSVNIQVLLQYYNLATVKIGRH